MGFELRPYQVECIEAVQGAHARGLRRVLIALPTGTGKTVIFAALLLARGGRALILVHRDELLTQAVDKLLLAGIPKTDIGIVKAEMNQVHARLLVASVATLARKTRLQQIAATIETVIVDEAHHATATSYRTILEYVRAFEAEAPLVLGVTATALRADGTALGEIFQEIVYEKTLLEMIRAQYLADIQARQVKLAVDFNRLHTRAGDFIDNEVGALLLDAGAPQHVASAYCDFAAGRKALVFTPTVDVAKAMTAALVTRGVHARTVYGEMPRDERRAVLQQFKNGAIQVVSNCAVLTEGYDEPSVDCIIIAKPTKSQPLYVQMVGRGTRRYPGKANCLVLDIVGITRRHDLVTAATLFGVPPDGTITQSVVGAVAEQEQDERARATAQAIEGRVVAQVVDLFTDRPLNWVSVSAGHFTMMLGPGGALHLLQHAHGWSVVRVTRTNSINQREVIATGLPLDYAVGTGEDLARKLGPSPLIDRAAKWRSDPASASQLHYLRKWRIRHAPTITKGEAADLMTARIARKAV